MDLIQPLTVTRLNVKRVKGLSSSSVIPAFNTTVAETGVRIHIT